MLIQQVRLVPVGATAPSGRPADAPVDVRINAGVITKVGAQLRPSPVEEVLEAEGRWAIPGLWDHHVHFTIWAQTLTRLDTSGTGSAQEVTRRVADRVATLPDPQSVVTGFGHRSASWPSAPTVAELDAVSGEHPVVLISGDGHNGWLNTRALELLDAPRTGLALSENEWFPVFARLKELPGADEPSDATLRTALERAAALGVVGIVDLDFGTPFLDWPGRISRGLNHLRVRTATYPEHLDEVVTASWATGALLPGGRGLITMGPLKIISDGSLNTRTAWCHEPYADGAALAHPSGSANLSEVELTDLMAHATAHRLEIAVHAIGDAAVGQALDAVATTGARGSIEHAQLMTHEDVARFGRLPLRASVQPAHLLDDRDVAHQCWPDRTDRCFMLRSLLDAGASLALGSDAPVSPLDPWLAMAAAVRRTGDARPEWNSAESLTAAEGLAASVDGRGTLTEGAPGDVVVLDEDPLAPGSPDEIATRFLSRPVAATVVAGRVTHRTL